MMREYNETSFAPEEVEKGLHLDLLNTLFKFNRDSDKCYNDIHITSDGYCLIVEWVQRDYDEQWGEGRFDFVRGDQRIVNEVYFPDGHYEYLLPETTEGLVNEWLEENKEEFGDYYYDNNINEIVKEYSFINEIGKE